MVAVDAWRDRRDAKTSRHNLFHVLHKPSPGERLTHNGGIEEIRSVTCSAIFRLRKNLPSLCFLFFELRQPGFCLSRLSPQKRGSTSSADSSSKRRAPISVELA